MNESLLQFIWQYSLYKPGELYTTNGEQLNIISPGKLNRDAGPDFLEAKIKVGKTILVGNIELHINSSDWLKHGHHNDLAYSNLILHVVYKNDSKNILDHTPVLEIGKHIPQYVIAQYTNLIQTTHILPCATQLHTVKDIVKESWLNRLLAERWEQKLADWKELLQKSAGDWRNLLYWRMAANFGFKVNTVPFLALSRSLPLNILAKHRENLTQIEALLFGQAGMLETSFSEEYPKILQAEYKYLKQKYKLQPIAAHQWKFLRMRPANFPTIRLAQFAGLVHKSLHLFSQIIETNTIKEIQPLLDITASEYWNTHFLFDEPYKNPTDKHLGTSSVHNIIINTIAPIQFLYAYKHGMSSQQEKALQLLDTVPPEQNKVLKLWKENGWNVVNAAQSQSLLQLHNNYCSAKCCLECSIGLNIIRSEQK